MKHFAVACAVFALLGSAAGAGVVVQMEVSGSDSAGEVETLYAQGEMIRMDSRSPRDGEEMSVIFRDQTMWFVNHAKKNCQKIDEAGMADMSSQLSAAMKQLENIPPEQRAMMEKMMKGRMPGMGKAQPRRVEAGAADRVGKYACTIRTFYSGDRKVWEACAVDQSAMGALSEAMGAFRAMSRFTHKLQEAVQQGPFAAMIENPYNELEELSGFPVRTRMFDRNGGITRETTLKSITREDVEASLFAIPKGYKVQDLKDQMKKER